MRYLILSNEYGICPLRDEYELPKTDWPIPLDMNLRSKIETWKDDYNLLELLDVGEENVEFHKRKILLDKIGQQIARQIETELASRGIAVKVKY